VNKYQTLMTNLFGFITDIIYKNNNDQSKGTINTQLICIIINIDYIIINTSIRRY